MAKKEPLPAALIDAEQAFATSAASDRSRWPVSTASDNRLFPDCRPRLKPKFRIARDARVFAIGSCFARNIEEYLVRLGLDVISSSIEFPAEEMAPNSRRNDLLVKYTPPSILAELRYALDEECSFDEQVRFLAPLRSGKIVDLNLPSWYSAVPHKRAIERRHQITELFAKIRSADLVIITLGLIEAWYDRQADGFICEVPSRDLVTEYPGRFSFVLLDYGQALHYTQESIKLIRKANAAAKIVLTTSPVPLGRTFTEDDIIVANGYAKAVLRAVAGDIGAVEPGVDYYPSYEMVMLSDPRTSWQADQRHVADSRVGDVIRTFISFYIPDVAREIDAARDRYINAKILCSRREYAEALKEFGALASFFPGDRAFVNDMCLAAEQAGDNFLAIKLHQELDNIEGRNDARGIRLANCYARIERHEEALAIAESIGVANIGAPLVKLDALIALGRTQAARDAARSMLQLVQSDSNETKRPDWVYKRLERSFRALGADENAELVRSLRQSHLSSSSS